MSHWVGKASIVGLLSLTQYEISSWNLIIYILVIVQIVIVYNSKSCNSSRHILRRVVLMIGRKIEIRTVYKKGVIRHSKNTRINTLQHQCPKQKILRQ